jgi:hypothetical protein
MCIIAGPVLSVENTNIFVGNVSPTQQLTLYSNKVSFNNSCTMILPYRGRFVRWVDMSKHKNFFQNLYQFYAPMTQGRTLSDCVTRSASRFVVQQLGSYLVGKVDSLDELVGLSSEIQEHFKLPENLASVLRENYSEGYGFALFTMTKSDNFHPMGYVTEMETEWSDLFIPTRHYHEHANASDPASEHADWDHNIYVCDKKCNLEKTGFVMWDNYLEKYGDPDLNIPLSSIVTLYRVNRGNNSNLPNADLMAVN